MIELRKIFKYQTQFQDYYWTFINSKTEHFNELVIIEKKKL